MNPSNTQNIISLSNLIKHLSKNYTVDLAGISNKYDFNNYSKHLSFKYKYINTKKQLSKICDFITENKKHMNYDWYIKTRPDILILDYNIFDIKKFNKDAINARAREYEGSYKGKYACSVGGNGDHKNVKACFNNNKEKIVLDDQIYIFHKNIKVDTMYLSKGFSDTLKYSTVQFLNKKRIIHLKLNYLIAAMT
jgi:hypothetical protein